MNINNPTLALPKGGGRRKGFTLVELLIVIAIIGVLSSIVLTNLNTARGRAKDAAIKEGMSQMATLMELNFQEYDSYCQLQYGWITTAPTCNSIFSGNNATKGREICTNIYNNAGEFAGGYKIYSYGTDCNANYSFMIALNNGKWYCSGSSNRKGEYADYTSNPGCYDNP